ncbi:MAG TPA: YggT family protein [Candidatus Aphodousia gallistercoris]|nr:YggT family protein [Candidatus Aphodousia gallistercoris]
MLASFLAFIFHIVTTFIGCLLILRAYVFYQRLSIFDPIARLAWFGTNWLVVPLSRLFKSTRRWEWPTIVAALIMAGIVAVVTRQVTGLPFNWFAVPICAIFLLFRWVLELVLWGTIIFVVLSWLQPSSPAYGMFWRLMTPILSPISNRLPRLGGFDFSPVLIFILVNLLLYWVTPISQGYFVSAWF